MSTFEQHATDPWYMDDAHHILAPDGSELTLCGGPAYRLHTLPPDTTVWPDGNAACWTCWGVRRRALRDNASQKDAQ